MTHDPIAIRSQWFHLRDTRAGGRAVDIARELGVSEAALVASACGEEGGPVHAQRLTGPWDAFLARCTGLGRVKTITRNPQVVLEVEGSYDKVEFFGAMGQSLGDVDLRIFIQRWRHGFCVTERTPKGSRRSLQFFDAQGVAIHKVYVTRETNVEAFDALVRDTKSADASPMLEVEPPPPPANVRPDADIDAKGLREAWLAMRDTHEFFGMLRRFDVARTQALRVVGNDLAYPVPTHSFETALRAAAAAELPFMVFVGNRGLIQIHTGPVRKIVMLDEWLNVLDMEFNLHVRHREITEAWIVRKPTADGIVTALEFYSADGEQVALLVGKRKPGQSEDERWRTLIASL